MAKVELRPLAYIENRHNQQLFTVNFSRYGLARRTFTSKPAVSAPRRSLRVPNWRAYARVPRTYSDTDHFCGRKSQGVYSRTLGSLPRR